ALGVIRMLIEKDLPTELVPLLNQAYDAFGDKLPSVRAEPVEALTGFIYDRLSGSLREQGFSAQEVDAVMALRPQRLAEVSQRLNAVRAFAALPEAPALAAANKRIGNILKKSEGEGAAVNPALFAESAEKDLYAAMQATLPTANAQFDAGDYTASLQTLAALRTPVDAFFDGVMVNADDPKLKANRLGLLGELHQAMNRVADLSRLAS
ncbi:glycine--tRNA ligase subunit beta, partial [Hydrogenophaga sp.]|uniref:glycine--tRNA ligase subunit beta n=1 Tax=Hydrogenophaga sp. TaxID=1904254 RepID=UPI003566A723